MPTKVTKLLPSCRILPHAQRDCTYGGEEARPRQERQLNDRPTGPRHRQRHGLMGKLARWCWRFRMLGSTQDHSCPERWVQGGHLYFVAIAWCGVLKFTFLQP